jgi:hypothetical protein
VTATSTPRLGLPAPVDSDLFLASDFNAAFTELDNVPGVTIVTNYAALTALTWGTAQHGSKVIQIDNGAEWYWYNPSGVGSWKRSNCIGMINYTIQSAPVSTSVTTGGATVLDTGNFTLPGGRPVMIDVQLGLDNTSGLSGQAIVLVNDNGSLVASGVFRPGLATGNTGTLESIRWVLNSPAHPVANGSSHRITVQIRSSAQSAGNGGQGTTSSRTGVIAVYEF